MSEFPYTLTVYLPDRPKTARKLTCLGLLRGLEKKREVLDATWNGRPVIVKVFSSPKRAQYHVEREWQGLTQLRLRGLNAPKPLFTGTTEKGEHALVTEKITDARTIQEIWCDIKSRDEKIRLLAAVCRELAVMHTNGVVQTDLHLGNFLKKGDKLYALDAAQMIFLKTRAGKKRAISQLAALLAFVPFEGHKGTFNLLCEEYARVRKWKFTKSDIKALLSRVKAFRKHAIERFLKKCLRTNRRNVRIRKRNILAVATRDFYAAGDFSELVNNMDELMAAGTLLKKGNTCTVAAINWGNMKIVVKRYNFLGRIHSLRHTIKGSRARRNWLYAHELWARGIPTAPHLAFIEKSKGKIIHQSYYIMEFVEGRYLAGFLTDKKISAQKRHAAAENAAELINKLGENKITHGDLKHTNILIAKDGLKLIDLDAMKFHKRKASFKQKRKKDIARFLKNFPRTPELSAYFKKQIIPD